MAKDFIVSIELQSIDTSTIGAGVFSEIGNPLEGALAFIRITNDSDTDVIISYDGVTDHEYIPAGDAIKTYFQDSAIPGNYIAKLRKGTIVHARGTAGTGLLYVSGYYNG